MKFCKGESEKKQVNSPNRTGQSAHGAASAIKDVRVRAYKQEYCLKVCTNSNQALQVLHFLRRQETPVPQVE